MATYVGRLLTAVSSALEFNQATLSGAIDIIVIEDEKGKRHSSPFHVRFGKLQLLKSRGIPVAVELNGKLTSLRLHLGPAGEAYFYTPRSRTHVNAGTGADALGLELDHGPNLTGEGITQGVYDGQGPSASSPQLPTVYETDSSEVTSGPSIASAADGGGPNLSGLRRADSTPSRGAAQATAAISASIPSSQRHDTANASALALPDAGYGYVSDSEVEVSRNEREGTAEVVDEPRSPPVSGVQRRLLRSYSHSRTRPGRDQVAKPSPGPPPPPPHSTPQQTDASTDAEPTGTSHEEPSMVLPPSRGIERPTPSDTSAAPAETPITTGGGAKTKQVGDCKTDLATPSDLIVVTEDSTAGAGTEDSKLELRSLDGYDEDEEADASHARMAKESKTAPAQPRELSKALLALHSEPDAEGSNDADRKKDGGDTLEPGTGRAMKNGGDHDSKIAMSLCGDMLTEAMDDDTVWALFQTHRVDYHDFATNPSMLYDSRLVFLIDNRLVDFRVAAPFVMSNAAFGESLETDTLSRRMSEAADVASASTAAHGTPPLTEVDGGNGGSSGGGGDSNSSGDQRTSSRSYRSSWFPWTRRERVEGRPLLDDVGDDAGVAESAAGERADGSASDRARGRGAAGQSSDTSTDDMFPPNRLYETDATDGGDDDSTHVYDDPVFDPENEDVSLVPSAEQLAELELRPGANLVRFLVESSAVELSCRIFLWRSDAKIVISDVDGTITRSDVLGHVLPAVGRDWSHVGVASLYSQIASHGYKFMYLTARPIGQASQTRGFLQNVTQGDARLPSGPVLMSPNRLVESFTREVIRRKPQEFKIGALRDIRCLFAPDYNPFHAGFGNRETDVISYRAVGLLPQRIFVVNTQTELAVMERRFESAASYNTLRELVDSVFPDIRGKFGREVVREATESAAFNDWNYWRPSLPDVDLDELLGKKG